MCYQLAKTIKRLQSIFNSTRSRNYHRNRYHDPDRKYTIPKKYTNILEILFSYDHDNDKGHGHRREFFVLFIY